MPAAREMFAGASGAALATISHVNRASIIAAAIGLVAAACAAVQEVESEPLCAAEHLVRADEHHRAADEHFAEIDPEMVEPGLAERPIQWPAYGAEVYELGDPEQYIVNPQVHSPDERHVAEARRHRRLAEQHEAAAAALNGGCPPPVG